jgi:hypothetical protein
MVAPDLHVRPRDIVTHWALTRALPALILSAIIGQYSQASAGPLLFTGSPQKLAGCIERTMRSHDELLFRSAEGNQIRLTSLKQVDVIELQQLATVPPNQRWTDGFYRLQITITSRNDTNAEVVVTATFFGRWQPPPGFTHGPYPMGPGVAPMPMGPAVGGPGGPSDWRLLTSKGVLEVRWEKTLRSECTIG